MALDEPRDNDQTHEIEGFTYLVNDAFMDQVKSIKVDFQDIGFQLTCGVPIGGGGGCSGCGTTSDCCST